MIESLIMALLAMNHTNETNTIPFPVEKTGVTFCYHAYQKHLGTKEAYIECNWVDMSKKKIQHLRDHLENYSASK